MTILPKKKAEQQKGGSDDDQSSDHNASPHGASGHGASHGSPHQLDDPYDDAFSPHHHRGSPDAFYHRYTCIYTLYYGHHWDHMIIEVSLCVSEVVLYTILAKSILLVYM